MNKNPQQPFVERQSKISCNVPIASHISVLKNTIIFLCVYSWNEPKRTQVSAFKSFLKSHFVVTHNHLRAGFLRLLLCTDLLLSQLPSPAAFHFLLCYYFFFFFFEVRICLHPCNKALGKTGAAGSYCNMKSQLMKQAVVATIINVASQLEITATHGRAIILHSLD